MKLNNISMSAVIFTKKEVLSFKSCNNSLPNFSAFYFFFYSCFFRLSFINGQASCGHAFTSLRYKGFIGIAREKINNVKQ